MRQKNKLAQPIHAVEPKAAPEPRPRLILDRLALAFGLLPKEREEIVRGMLSQHAKGAVSYWFQLLLAMGIATLGLVLNSTGVVIAAMLVAPLMGPIIGVGMSLAIGSPYLFMRSLLRCLFSIIVVVAGSALLCVSLPFQEVTQEISARTSPTLLDLFVAIFCALAGAFTTVQRASEVASTAAGTSIGISLVPPLCVVGFGLGIGKPEIAGGAALLFTANLSAILLFTVLMFVSLGFGVVDALALEDETLNKSIAAARVSGGLRRLFGSRHVTLLRVMMPVALVAAIYAPLRRALEEVSWQVRVRSQITQALQRLTNDQSAVTTSLVIERRSVVVRMVLVSQEKPVEKLEEEIRTQIASISGVIPTIELTIVPDQEALQNIAKAFEKTVQDMRPPPPPPSPDLALLRQKLSEALRQNWPSKDAGEIVSWGLSWEKEKPILQIAHLGEPIGDVAEALLTKSISQDVTPIFLKETSISLSAQSSGDLRTFLPWLVRAVSLVGSYPSLYACVRVPTTPAPAPFPALKGKPPESAPTPSASPDLELVRALCSSPSCQVEEQGEVFSVRLSTSTCSSTSQPTSQPLP